jgi:hypothetical protein
MVYGSARELLIFNLIYFPGKRLIKNYFYDYKDYSAGLRRVQVNSTHESDGNYSTTVPGRIASTVLAETPFVKAICTVIFVMNSAFSFKNMTISSVLGSRELRR